MSELLPVCVLAGGLATRLGSAAAGRPKALVEVAGEPFIFHQLRALRESGARQVVVCVGHLGDQVEEALGDGARIGVQIEFVRDGPEPAGTAGAVRRALPLLGEAFFVLYGDTYLRVDHQEVQRAFRSSAKPALLTVLRNEGRWDTSNTEVADDLVVKHDKQEPGPEMLWIDYGLSVLTAAAMSAVPGEPADLSEVYSGLARQGLLAAFEVTERFYEIGTPEALAETRAFLSAQLGRAGSRGR
jgi:NDP-sugar pyrophosphorylase family protein